MSGWAIGPMVVYYLSTSGRQIFELESGET
jgi:hypothetical protein